MNDWWSGYFDVDHMEDKNREMPEEYDSAADAIAAMLHSADEWLSLRFSSGLSAKINTIAAACAIEKEASSLTFKGDDFWKLYSTIGRTISDFDSRKKIQNVLKQWATENWSVVRSKLAEVALSKFGGKHYSSTYDEFGNFVAEWSKLVVDAPLLESALIAMESGGADLNAGTAQLNNLGGGKSQATRVIAANYSGGVKFNSRDELASLIAKWAGDSTWAQLNKLLWRTGQKNENQQSTTEPSSVSIIRVVELLREFGILQTKQPSYKLSELAAETRASWRRELSLVIGNSEELREATTEALLLYGSTDDDRAVLFAALELHSGDTGRTLSYLQNHLSQLVRRRVSALVDMADSRPDAMTLFPASRTSVASIRLASRLPSKPRTWIGDARIEQLIEDTLDQAAGNAAIDINNALDSGEETHVPLLFERLRASFLNVTRQLAAYAAETNANERISLKLEHRIIGKQEEGGVGINSEKFSADVCLLFEAREAGKVFSRRASLIQAKRLYRNKGTITSDYYPFKKSQLEDLSTQTFAGFLLLLGPECDGVKMPLIPARLVLDLIERGEPASQISPTRAASLGKGIGSWLIEDVIGLWTGDVDSNLVTRAAGAKDRKPFLLAELVVERFQKGPDGWLVES